MFLLVIFCGLLRCSVCMPCVFPPPGIFARFTCCIWLNGSGRTATRFRFWWLGAKLPPYLFLDFLFVLNTRNFLVFANPPCLSCAIRSVEHLRTRLRSHPVLVVVCFLYVFPSFLLRFVLFSLFVLAVLVLFFWRSMSLLVVFRPEWYFLCSSVLRLVFRYGMCQL